MKLEIRELWEELKFDLGGMKMPKLDGVKDRKLLLGGGNTKGEILFIGDDPDLFEDENMRVLPGTSGEFFIKLCDLADLSPEKYYITNISKCILRWRELSEEEKEVMREYLDMQIALIKPKIIVALGPEVVTVLLNEESNISDVRGKVYNWEGNIKVIPTYDPGYVKRMRGLDGKKARPAVEFWNDLKMIKTEL
ncbi:uracil-DNA glycosylase [uncultured Ilyobacter sp.]|jgi:DNA polymerase|uniref:uracil-DNA glycosylase n=1 Tax=uncultured Ilyobacter sp. TaxID=544433 RepID=UPI0029C0ED04|nr:uracil-DNA glycosylase [uncultured Ilyobacter sp.]